MSWIDWSIVIVPVTALLAFTLRTKKYVNGLVDYIAAGRVAGRYVLNVSSMEAVLSVITLVALVEAKYQTGYGIEFWSMITLPIGIVISLSGFITYRFRETKALSNGQFLEMRYSRSFRIFASILRILAEMLTNSIGPAVAANFFIYFFGIPHYVHPFGVAIPTFVLVVLAVILLSLVLILPGGRISLLISDCIQGLMSYPIFVIMAGYILINFSWFGQVVPVMLDRVSGESFINPFDVDRLRDFNLFALVATITGNIINRGAYIGNDTSNSARTPHEQKMSGILSTWRYGYSLLNCLLIAIAIITFMNHKDFAAQSHKIRLELTERVAAQIVPDAGEQKALNDEMSLVPMIHHLIGVDQPLSQSNNIDTPFMEAARKHLSGSPEKNQEFQKFRTLYHQMMLPVVFRNLLPAGLLGLFALLMVMLMVSTDDSRIFNASAAIVQDLIVPFLREPLRPESHLRLIKICTILTGIFFFFASFFMSQMDYINMFLTIMVSIWLGGAGPVILFGLYSRFGNTVGAYCAIIFGSGFSVLGLFLQRSWAQIVYPFIESQGWAGIIDHWLKTCSTPLTPYIDWEMSPIKFPINAYEWYFMAMMISITAYVIGSLVTYKEPFNLDRMLHRGKYNIDGTDKSKSAWSWKTVWSKLIGITPEYTRGDKIIAWSVVLYSVGYQFGMCFVAVLVWNLVSPWTPQWWGKYFFITNVCVICLTGIVSTFWFIIGGIIDLRRLFKDLAARINNPLDNGMVAGHVSLAEKAAMGDEDEESKGDGIP